MVFFSFNRFVFRAVCSKLKLVKYISVDSARQHTTVSIRFAFTFALRYFSNVVKINFIWNLYN